MLEQKTPNVAIKNDLLKLKEQYLLDERGMIRSGVLSMTDYARILYAEDEDILNEIILEIMASGDVEDVDLEGTPIAIGVEEVE